MRALPAAVKEFDRFEEGARSAFIRSLKLLATSRETNRHLKKVPDWSLGEGTTHTIRASRELRVHLSREPGGAFIVRHLVRRNDRRFYDSEF